MVNLSSSLMFGNGIQEYEGLIDIDRMRRERADKMRTAMKKHDVAACLVTRGDNVRIQEARLLPLYLRGFAMR